ncbi:type II toxin-antitoxin system prevent-host-death family antitoxin [Methylocystis heyeri]|uniref:Type II toxin-antitoxin system prevent-host-death family antitoxin n=1 Tax=Methylocystis heyeri TaxID=391905 RepID=A0A6B8KBN4_9HYPH|nr:type II toxin-antitoxin system prevent-host-death family antitoxin [Methylocystis heyeri]QGM45087.1 type II toxin-antitoxin system prevent-host-death family antitoxin [Methylocystis heyeri]
MRRFTTVELDKNIGDIKAVAAREPVIITEHRKDRFVMMSIEDFERLRKAGAPQRAFGAGETPPEIAGPFLAEIDRVLDTPDDSAPRFDRIWRYHPGLSLSVASAKPARRGRGP